MLAARYPKSSWRTDAILHGLLRFPYWRIPTPEEANEQTGGLSRAPWSATVCWPPPNWP